MFYKKLYYNVFVDKSNLKPTEMRKIIEFSALLKSHKFKRLLCI